MSRKLSAEDIFDIVEVDLWGNAYTLRTVTRTISAKLDAAEKRRDGLPDDASDDDAAGAMIEVIDILLKPTGDTPTAVELLIGLWERDELGFDWLTAFMDRLGDEAEQRRRPTSPTANGV